jgi:shikimate dehydrogenase
MSQKIYGLIGYPVKHSLSAAMHNAAFKYLKIDAEYQLFEVKPEDLESFLLKTIADKTVCGLNVTIPHKIKAKEIMDGQFKGLSEYDAVVAGAINTIRFGGSACYKNTDVSGFRDLLTKDMKFDYKNKNVFIFGCGGAGRAVVAALLGQDRALNAGKIFIFDANPAALDEAKNHFHGLDFARKDFFVNKLEFVSISHVPEAIKKSQLLVNASPVGMREGDSSPVFKGLLHKELAVCDVVYNKETQLVKDAKALGLPAIGGLGMLLYQGVASFEFWKGSKIEEPVVDLMRKALLEAVKKS